MKIAAEETKKTALRLHHLDKTEHFVRAFIGITLVCIRHLVVGLKILAPKMIDLKTALVYVEMDVALFKIRRADLPNHGVGMQSLNRLPSAVTDAFGVFLGSNKQNLKLVMMCFFVDLQNYATDLLPVHNDAVGFAIGRVDATLDGFARDDLSFKIKVIVSVAELLDRAVLERPLIIKNELLTVVCCEGSKSNLRVFHNYLRK